MQEYAQANDAYMSGGSSQKECLFGFLHSNVHFIRAFSKLELDHSDLF